MREDFPNWTFRTKDDRTVAFKNLRCIGGFEVAVRVGVDGVVVFGKNEISPNLLIMNKQEFACMEDFIGKSRDGIKAYEVGCVQINGELWFSECMYNPGVLDKDFNDLRLLLVQFYHTGQNPALSLNQKLEDHDESIIIA